MDSRSRRRLSVVVASVLLSFGLSAPAEAASSVTALSVDSQPGSLLGLGVSSVFTLSNSTISFSGSGTHVSVTAFNNQNPGLFVDGVITPPKHQTLAVGTYETTEFPSLTTAGLEMNENGLACEDQAGSLIISEIVFDARGHVTRFAATYEDACGGAGNPASYGEYRLNSTLSYAAVATDTAGLTFPNQLVNTTSAPLSATVTNLGSVKIRPGTVSMDGTNVADFAVTANTCTGAILVVNASCSLTATFTPSDVGVRTATLHLPVNTYRGEVEFTLQGTGITKGTSTLTVAATPTQVPPGGTSVLSGTLALSDGVPPGVQSLHVLETPPGGTQTEIGQATTDDFGRYSFTTPGLDVAGVYAFELVWDGTPLYDGSNASTNVTMIDTRIVFDSNRSGTYDVYSMNPDGSDVTALSPTSSDDVTARLSPDGRKIAFASAMDGNFEIFTMNADGTGLAQLTVTTTSFNAWPTWSPDGTKIAFVSTRSDAYGDIWSMNADGTGLVQLTTYAGVDEFPSWSPDGTKIAFDSFRSGNYEVYTMNTDGTGVVALTTNAADDYEPAWSPDGTKIAFTSNRSGTYEVWTMTSSGASLTQLTTGASNNVDPTWSPDGTQIAFDSDQVATGTLELFTMNADGTGTTQLSSTGGINELPDWGPVPSTEPVPAPVTGVAPGAISTGAGNVDLFDESRSSTIEHTSAVAGAWGATENLGGTPASAPGVASAEPGELDVFVRGTDNALWEDTNQSGSWSGWVSLGGVLASAPAAVSDGLGNIDVFVRGTDAKVWQRSYTNGVWGVWKSLGGALPAGAAPAAASMAANQLEVFTRGTDNAVWWKSWNGSVWTGWASLGGVIANDPAASSALANQVTMVARGAVDDKLWYRTYTSPTWSGWKSVAGGPMRSGPAAAAFQRSGVTDVFALFVDGNIWETVYDGVTWSSWSIVPPGAAPHEAPPSLPANTPRWRSSFSRRGALNPNS